MIKLLQITIQIIHLCGMGICTKPNVPVFIIELVDIGLTFISPSSDLSYKHTGPHLSMMFFTLSCCAFIFFAFIYNYERLKEMILFQFTLNPIKP
ncbi:MAG: hypothetical protein IPL23_28435 [Saprospiraceae bacterium]|nr:hypothetical protein [Saprospiraceae bacterium]